MAVLPGVRVVAGSQSHGDPLLSIEGVSLTLGWVEFSVPA